MFTVGLAVLDVELVATDGVTALGAGETLRVVAVGQRVHTLLAKHAIEILYYYLFV